jgi:hypothetical protein
VLSSRTLRVVRRHIVYLFLNAIITFFSLAIIKDKDIFFSCPARIEALSVVSLVFIFNSARAVDRFFTVLSASVKYFS